jgi:hypothetical protein
VSATAAAAVTVATVGNASGVSSARDRVVAAMPSLAMPAMRPGAVVAAAGAGVSATGVTVQCSSMPLVPS